MSENREVTRRVLPVPVRTRFQPLRAGLLNVWEYDDQEFWFHDGCLILRGANEAGKSKALELLLPFLLDADMRPQRLDPFGEKSKDMFWNLVGFDPERSTAIGYCWIEFGRIDRDGTPRFVTLGIGMRASAGAKGDVKSWSFVTHNRIRDGIELVERSTPIARDRLEQVLGKGSVYTTPRDYRAAVDRELFGLGIERYEALIHLLLQLRRPHLSDSLDPGKLSDVLTESLPPLDAERVAQLATAFDHLDAEADSLNRLENSRDSVLGFRDEYRAYGRPLARRRAAEVRSASSKFDGVTRRVRSATEALEGAHKTIEALEHEESERKTDEAKLEAKQKGLQASEEMQAAERLMELKATATALRDKADQLIGQAKETTADLDVVLGEASEMGKLVRAASDRRQGESEASNKRAAAAGLGGLHNAHSDEIWLRPAKARAALVAEIERKLAAIKVLKKLREQLKQEQSKRRECQRAIDNELTPRKLEADEQAKQAAGECDAERVALGAAISAWTGTIEPSLSATETDALIEEAVQLVSAGKSCGTLGFRAIARQLSVLDAELSAVAVEVQQLGQRRQELNELSNRIASEHDDGPLGGPVKTGQLWTGQIRPVAPGRRSCNSGSISPASLLVASCASSAVRT